MGRQAEPGQSGNEGPRVAVLLSLLLFFIPLDSAAARAVEELQPRSPWHVNWDKAACTLSREFGTEQAPLIIYLERFAPGDGFQLVISSKRLEGMTHPPSLSIKYGADGYIHKAGYMPGKTSKGMATILISGSSLAETRPSEDGKPQVSPEQEAAIREISLSKIKGRELVLKTGSLGNAFAALRKCTDNLVSSWGLDPEQLGRARRLAKPRTYPGGWIRSSDYPKDAWLSRTQSVVNFRLSVDALGKPTQCEITRSYSGERFDKLSCDLLMRRASFEPALDADGTPIASYYLNTVRWILP